MASASPTAPLLLLATPRNLPLGANASLPASLLCVASTESNQSRISTLPRPNYFPFLAGILSHRSLFPGVERVFPASSWATHDLEFRKLGAPTLASPTPNLGLPLPRSGKLLPLMQPGAFVSLLLPPRRSWEIRKEQSGGEK